VFKLAVKAETDVENGDLRLALQPNGDIVVASTASQGLAELFVARLTPNGSLDTSFNAAGTPGYVQQDVESYGSHTSAKATDADGVAVAPSTGDIWVDGDATFASSTDAFLYCLTSAGAACASDSAGTA
jgi:hypothetical protein